MNQVRLFLENKEVELTESVQFLLNKQWEDITNPTIIINDWSKTLDIPCTQRNDTLFSHIYNVDYVIVTTGFNPYKKIDFRLEWGDSTIMTGYAKMNSVTRKDTRTFYNLTLNGELGKVFQELKKITFDKSRSSEPYFIDGSQYYNVEMNKELIYDSWNNNRGSNNIDEATHPRDFVCWAPSNAFSPDFDYKSYIHTDKKNYTLESAFEEDYRDRTSILPSTIIGDGIVPRSIGEMRSYNQLPFYWWDMFWQIFQKKAEELTSYSWVLDEDWFNSQNPYWNMWVMKVGDFPVKEQNDENILKDDMVVWKALENSSSDIHRAYPYISSLPPCTTPRYGWFSPLSPPSSGNISKDNAEEVEDTSFFTNDQYFLVPSHSRITFNLPRITLRTSGWRGQTESAFEWMRVKGNAKLKITITAVDFNDDSIVYGEGEEYIIDKTKIVFSRIIYPTITFTFTSGPITLNNTFTTYNGTDVDKKMKLKIGFSFIDVNGSPLEGVWTDAVSWFDSKNGIFVETIETDTFTIEDYIINRSFSGFDYNDLWHNDYTPFTFILNYCKMFRIGIFVDDINHTLTFKPIHKFLYEGRNNVLDWTSKVDYSKDFKIYPISFENKYVLFNYDGGEEIKDNTNYKENYGFQYGEKNIETSYEFNTETESLFEGILPTLPYTPPIMSWKNLMEYDVKYTLPNEVFFENVDKDNKKVDRFGAWGFSNGLRTWDTSGGMKPVIITDDSITEIKNDTYCYNQSGNDKMATDYYHCVTDYIRHGYDRMVTSTFTVPKKIYHVDTLYPRWDIYDLFWKKYIEERYNENNKRVECWVDLKPEEFQAFKFNTFVRIENQMYFVNRIYDYDLTSNETTKVELITIQNPNNYYTNQYF